MNYIVDKARVWDAVAEKNDIIASLRAELADARAQVAHVEGVCAGLNDDTYSRDMPGREMGENGEKKREKTSVEQTWPERFQAAVHAACGPVCRWPNCCMACQQLPLQVRNAIEVWNDWIQH